MTDLRKRSCLARAILVGLLLLAACDQPKQAVAPAPQPAVGVRPVAMKGVNQSFEFVGHIKAVNKVDVRARVEGFLDKVLFSARYFPTLILTLGHRAVRTSWWTHRASPDFSPQDRGQLPRSPSTLNPSGVLS